MTAADPIRERVVEVDGRPTRVLDRGAGERAVVLLHGGLAGHGGWTGAADLWGPLLDGLDLDGARVVAIDLPGCGGSPVDDPAELTVEAITVRSAAVLGALGVATAVVVGHGDASLVALDLARGHHDVAVGGAVVIAATGAAPTSDGVASLALLHPPAAAAARCRWALDRLSFSDAHVTDELVAALAAHEDGAARRSAVQALDRPGAQAALDADLLGAKMSLFAHCRDVGYDVPLSIIWGSHDPLVGVAHGDGLFGVLSTTRAHLELNVVNRTGHLPFREAPAAVGRLIRPFVTRCARTAGVRA